MRVVFDTNIFVSAFVIPGGKAEEAILRITEGKDALILSKDILDELLAVLSSKFSRDVEALSRTAVFLSDISETVKPSKKLHFLKDENDNRILECAVEGKADAVVTGDKAMLAIGDYEGIRILSLGEYLK